ncbi:MAG: sulfatase [Pirellulales bacterium]
MFRAQTTILAILSLWLAGPAIAAERRPNIVILLADDLGYADVGFQGCRDIPTPNIDALAKGGVRCTNGYVSGPYCSPTRAGLLTGRYQQRFGHEFNPGPRGEPGGNNVESIGLPLSEATIADRLKAAGYATGMVGKWHLGVAPKFHPQKRGFDEYFGFLGGAHVYLPGLPNIVFPGLQDAPGGGATAAAALRPGDRPRQPAPIYRGSEAVEEPEYLTDAFAREAVSFIERHQKQPFFLYLPFNAVHTPMHATDKRLEKFASISDPMRRTYCAMTLALDEAIGKVLDKLRSTSLEQDTLIFFCSDNGGPTVPRAALNGSRNTPLRGSKVSTLEGGIRVPFVVSWKGKLPPGKVYDQPVIQLDILPTALAAAGVEAKADWNLDGVNLLRYFKEETASIPHDALYWRLGQQMAIRKGDWKLVKYSQEFAGEEPSESFSPLRLYNLSRDIGETNDLASAQPERAKELKGLWDQWNESLIEPLWPQQSSAPNRPAKQQ